MAKKSATQAKPTRRRRTPDTATAAPQDTRRTAFRLSDLDVEQALQSGAHAGLLEDYFGPQQYRELQRLGQEAATRSVRGGPRVLILPGIMGSKLGTEGQILDDVLWIDPIEIALGRLDGLALPANSAKAEPVGVILFAYLKLKLRLRLAGYDARFWPYDWRLSLEELGQQLAATLADDDGTAVSLVAHSMGGLVARAGLATLKSTSAGNVHRLIMLGTPNYGSFSVPQAIRGTSDVVRKVAALDLKHNVEELAGTVFNTFPGLYQMLPWIEKYPDFDFCDINTWPRQGLLPRQEILDNVRNVQQGLATADERFFLIAGVNQETIVGARVEDDQFVYSKSRAGDGTVPLAFAELPGTKTYYVEEEHGSLPNNSTVEHAVIDLLARGSTDLLPDKWTPSSERALATVAEESLQTVPFGGRQGSELSQREIRQVLDEFVSASASDEPSLGPESRLDQRPTALTEDLNQVTVGRCTGHRLEIRLALGSIAEADAQAYALGVFRGIEPSGAVGAVDAALDGAITEFYNRRMFSGNVGEVFMLPTGRHLVRAENVVIVGLGAYDRYDSEVQKLTGEVIIRTLVRTKVDDVATVLSGAEASKSLAATLGNLLAGILRGLRDADPEHRFRSLTICEHDPARYGEIKRELYRLASTHLFDDIEVTFDELELPAPFVASRAVRRVEPEPAPLYLIVSREDEHDGEVMLRSSVMGAGGKATVFTATKSCVLAELDEKLGEIEGWEFSLGTLPTFGKELAQLVLPAGVLEILATMTEEQLVVVHDAFASRVPWETLSIGDRFPAITGGLNRRYVANNLSIAKWLESRQTGNVLDVLLIVNPTQDLPGAEREGTNVEKVFKGHPSVKIHVLRGADATKAAVLEAFRSGNYDVVHYAGHASFDPVDPARSGIYCHDYRVLSGGELTGLAHLPALMFFNACESGRVRSSRNRRKPELSIATRLERSAGLAESFLRGGLANYIGTYWPVGDSSAMSFAETLYNGLLEGKPIGRALLEGRQILQAAGELDWADYIHYGSSSFVVKKPQS